MDKDYMRWFLDARFGMFIHWGIYAIPARGEWVRNQESISDEAYQPYFDTFDPIHYDPAIWARAARQAGMKYAVMTTKHHDGFCLFDSQHTDYKATNTPAKRDLTREYVDAFRAEGLKVGFYYSVIDWHHPDYPIAGDRFHPMRNHPDYKDHAGNMSRYADYLHAPGQGAADQLRQDRRHLVRLLLRRPERRGVARHRAGQDGARAPAGDHHRQPPGRQHQGGAAGDLRGRLRLAGADHPGRGRDRTSWASRSPGRRASP